MRQGTIRLGAVLSAILCLGVLGLWVRSYWFADRMIIADQYEFTTTPGRLEIARLPTGWFHSVPFFGSTSRTGTQSAGRLFRFWLQHQPITAPDLHGYRGVFRGLGFGLQYMHRLSPSPQWRLIEGQVPFGFLVMVSCLPAIYWWRTPATRKVAGLCASCGYDLRASPRRCPECGAAVARL